MDFFADLFNARIYARNSALGMAARGAISFFCSSKNVKKSRKKQKMEENNKNVKRKDNLRENDRFCGFFVAKFEGK